MEPSAETCKMKTIETGNRKRGANIAEHITDSLGIERNVAAASGAVFLVGLGEELWKKFLPKYLESLGASVAALGLQTGVRKGLLVTPGLAALAGALLLSLRLPAPTRDAVKMSGVWESFHPSLKRLLASDIVIRMCEGMADIFVVLYVTNVTGITIPKYGVLIAIQLMTAILIYVPSAKIAARVGRKPFVIATFFCFALYPITVILAPDF